jgi:uncharacterized protein YjbJ (UPF0337 family)
MSSRSEQIKGHVKSVAGIVTGNKKLQAEGDAQSRTSKAAAHVDDARDRTAAVLDRVKDRLGDAVDRATSSLRHK